jgi:hypothetical protein
MKRVQSVSDQCDQMDKMYRNQNFSRVGVMAIYPTLEDFEQVRNMCCVNGSEELRGIQGTESMVILSHKECNQSHCLTALRCNAVSEMDVRHLLWMSTCSWS